MTIIPRISEDFTFIYLFIYLFILERQAHFYHDNKNTTMNNIFSQYDMMKQLLKVKKDEDLIHKLQELDTSIFNVLDQKMEIDAEDLGEKNTRCVYSFFFHVVQCCVIKGHVGVILVNQLSISIDILICFKSCLTFNIGIWYEVVYVICIRVYFIKSNNLNLHNLIPLLTNDVCNTFNFKLFNTLQFLKIWSSKDIS